MPGASIPGMPMPGMPMPGMPIPGMPMPGMPMPGAPGLPNHALAPSGLPTLVSDDVSHEGARPLVTDPKLGWSTSVKLQPPSDGSHTRLRSDQVNIKLQSNTRWVIISIVLFLVVAGMVVLIIAT
jgi:hypothetical protein